MKTLSYSAIILCCILAARVDGQTSALIGSGQQLAKAYGMLNNTSSANANFSNLAVQHVAWLVIWLGESESNPDKSLEEAFLAIQETHGSVQLPYYVCFSDQRTQYLQEIANENLTPSTIRSGVMTTLSIRGTNLSMLIDEAKKRISSRSSYKFKKQNVVIPQ
ncbi:MAG: hypothetical protein WCS31_14255 [Verrucomicrobiae bacterium]